MKTKNEFGRIGSRFGGLLLKNSNAKTQRPLSSNVPVHMVVKSSLARGRRSFLFQSRVIEGIFRRHARKSRIKIFEFANGGDHLHFIFKIPRNRKHYAAFVRGFSGEIARFVMKARKGQKTISEHTRNYFWDQKPYSEILSTTSKQLNYEELSKQLQEASRIEALKLNQKTLTLMEQIREYMKITKLQATGFL